MAAKKLTLAEAVLRMEESDSEQGEESGSEQGEEETDDGEDLVGDYIDSSGKQALLPKSCNPKMRCDPCYMDSLLLIDQSLAQLGDSEDSSDPSDEQTEPESEDKQSDFESDKQTELESDDTHTETGEISSDSELDRRVSQRYGHEQDCSRGHGRKAPRRHGRGASSGRGRGASSGRGRGASSGRGRGASSGRGEGASSRHGQRASRGRGQNASNGRGEGASSRRGRGASRGRGRGASRGRGRGATRGHGGGASRRHGQRTSSEHKSKKAEFQWKGFGSSDASDSDISDSDTTDSEAAASIQNVPSFTATPGPSPMAFECVSPLSYFFLLLGEDFLHVMAEETNAYARQKGNLEFFVSETEMGAFIGLNIAMGIVDLPKVHDYWSVRPILRHPWFSMVMSRNRYLEIQKYLHFNDNSAKDNTSNDKLYKIRPILDIVEETFYTAYTPYQHVSIDEQMIGTKGRLSFLQYMPKKPKKWGIKIWALADSLNGYVSKFSIYTGASETGVQHGLAYGVVMSLMKPYLKQGYQLYVDNFYTSPKLFSDLLKEDTLACGTVRSDRKGLPKKAVKVHLKRGETCFKKEKKTNMTFVHWKDQRDVFCLSTMHGNSMEDYTTRRRDEDVQRPVMIGDYNKHMNGVDHMDQMLVYYAIGRKTIKWYKRIFWRLLEMAIVNGFVLYSLCNPECKKNQKNYRMDLAEQLVEEHLNERATDGRSTHSGGRPSAHSDCSRLRGKHFSQRSQKRKRCAVCGSKKKSDGKRKDIKTNNYCPKCDTHLCQGECFELFHTQYKF